MTQKIKTLDLKMGRFHFCIRCRAVVAFLLLTHRWRCSITAAHPSQSLYIQSMSQTHGSFPLWQTRCNEKKNISERKVLFLLVSALMLNKHPSTDFTGIMTQLFFPLQTNWWKHLVLGAGKRTKSPVWHNGNQQKKSEWDIYSMKKSRWRAEHL